MVISLWSFTLWAFTYFYFSTIIIMGWTDPFPILHTHVVCSCCNSPARRTLSTDISAERKENECNHTLHLVLCPCLYLFIEGKRTFQIEGKNLLIRRKKLLSFCPSPSLIKLVVKRRCSQLTLQCNLLMTLWPFFCRILGTDLCFFSSFISLS